MCGQLTCWITQQCAFHGKNKIFSFVYSKSCFPIRFHFILLPPLTSIFFLFFFFCSLFLKHIECKNENEVKNFFVLFNTFHNRLMLIMLKKQWKILWDSIYFKIKSLFIRSLSILVKYAMKQEQILVFDMNKHCKKQQHNVKNWKTRKKIWKNWNENIYASKFAMNRITFWLLCYWIELMVQ